MQGSTYNPILEDDFDKTKLNVNFQGVSGVMAAGTTTNLDYTLADDCLITGLEYWCGGGVFGDTLDLEIVDSTGAFSGTAGTVLDQFAFNWNVSPNQTTPDEIKSKYPAKVLAGMTLRIVYNSTGSNPVNLWANFELHKVLI